MIGQDQLRANQGLDTLLQLYRTSSMSFEGI